MDAQDIKSRIAKNEEIISRKLALIDKKKAKAQNIIASIMASELMKGDDYIVLNCDADNLLAFYRHVDARVRENGAIKDDRTRLDVYYMNCDLYDCYDSIHSNERTIAEKQATNAKYEAQLAKLNNEQSKIENFPQVIVEFRDNVAKMWDAWDKMRQASVRESKQYLDDLYKKYDAIPYSDASKKDAYKAYRAECDEVRTDYTNEEWYDLPNKSEEEIHAENMESANKLVLNFYCRVEGIVGEVEDASGLKLDQNNAGYCIINGLVRGNNGKVAKVQSVGAGGWNIQRFHIRVLTNEVKGVA